jgi:hypothetical protein
VRLRVTLPHPAQPDGGHAPHPDGVHLSAWPAGPQTARAQRVPSRPRYSRDNCIEIKSGNSSPAGDSRSRGDVVACLSERGRRLGAPLVGWWKDSVCFDRKVQSKSAVQGSIKKRGVNGGSISGDRPFHPRHVPIRFRWTQVSRDRRPSFGPVHPHQGELEAASPFRQLKMPVRCPPRRGQVWVRRQSHPGPKLAPAGSELGPWGPGSWALKSPGRASKGDLRRAPPRTEKAEKALRGVWIRRGVTLMLGRPRRRGVLCSRSAGRGLRATS